MGLYLFVICFPVSKLPFSLGVKVVIIKSCVNGPSDVITDNKFDVTYWRDQNMMGLPRS